MFLCPLSEVTTISFTAGAEKVTVSQAALIIVVDQTLRPAARLCCPADGDSLVLYSGLSEEAADAGQNHLRNFN